MSQQIVWGIDRLQTLPPVAAGVKVMLVADSSFPYLSIRRRIEEMRRHIQDSIRLQLRERARRARLLRPLADQLHIGRIR